MAETGHHAGTNYTEQGAKITNIAGTLQILPGGALILPTANPAVVGALWNNAGVITISAG